MEYSIQEVAKSAGVTSRTLRHWGDVGLLPPARVGTNGYRYYDDASLVRLQRILLLRQLGLGLDAIGELLDAQDARSNQLGILRDHLDLLRQDQDRISAQIAAVKRTINHLATQASNPNGDTLMSKDIFNGFDHTKYRDEVVDRWGEGAYNRSDSWWRGLGVDGRREWKAELRLLNEQWTAAAEQGLAPSSDSAQALAKRHVEWLCSIPGTPANEAGGDLADYLIGLGDLYVADARFAVNYGGPAGARFVQAALAYFVEKNLK